MDKLVANVRDRVLERIDLSTEIMDEEIIRLIQEEICEEAKRTPLSIKRRVAIESQIFNSLRKLDILEDLLKDDEITEIMINGPKDIFIEKSGQIEKSEMCFSSEEKLADVIQKIVADANKIVNETNPVCDSRLSDGSRINIVLPPAAVDYPIVTIRKFPKEKMTMEKLLEYGSVSEEIVEFLKRLVIAGYNIFISGGTGSGKTSFLNALAEFIPSEDRVITIEDSAELQLKNVSNIVRLEARDANLEGKNAISIRDLLKSSLRMRPDRLVIGEVRGAEALEMLQSFNTGHDGSFSTGHANSCEDMIHRLETMVLMGSEIPLLAVKQQIAAGIDIFVHLGRLRDRSRKVLEISEVVGMVDGEIQLNPLFVFKEMEQIDRRIVGVWEKQGELQGVEKLRRSGLA